MSVTNLLAQTGISLYSVLVEVLQSYRYAHVRLLSHTTSLMTGKACTLYVKVFEKLQEIVPEFSPTTVMADFENASVGAMKTVFGQILAVHGCWFHFSQAVVKYVRKIGLEVVYNSNDVVRKCIWSLTCLPLLPADAVEGAVADLETFATCALGIYYEVV